MNETLYQLKETFLQEWPLSRIQNMTLEEYTNLDKTSFCYWVEATTTDLGSIWGGSAYKFGIFKRKNLDSTTSKENLLTDGEYGWAKKYGTTKEIAFQNIKSILITIIENTQNNTIEQIDEIDLGDAYKWKIAFLYGDFNIINIFKNESLLEAAQSLGYTGTSKKFTDLYRFILPLKQSEQDFFEFTADLWQQTSLANPTRYWLYAPGENANKWDEFYEKGIIAIGWDDLGDLSQYKSRNEIKNALVAAYGGEGDKKNDVSANDDFINRINIGDVIIVKRGRSQLLGYGQVTSDYYFEENDGDFKNRRNVDWKLKGVWNVHHSLVLKTLTDITKYTAADSNYSKYYEKLLAIMKEENYKQAYSNYLSTIYSENSGTKTSYIKAIEILSDLLDYNIFEVNDISQLHALYDDLIKEQRNTEGKYFHPEAPSYGQNGFYSASIKTYIDFHKKQKDNSMNTSSNNRPLNQILYGPPGTGKTYNSINKAIEIINPAFDLSQDRKKVKEEFDRLVGLGQIVFTTFHQSMSYEDFIEGIKPKVEEDVKENKQVVYEIEDGIFKSFCDMSTFHKAFISMKKSIGVYLPMKTGSAIIENVNDDEISILRMTDNKKFKYNYIELFLSYEECKNDISELKNQKLKVAEYGYLIEYMLDINNRDNFVFIIDEINRGNVSAIFGELITLIEADKRIGAVNELKVKLPYSKKEFGVPPNLYIIGTMNTADRSVEALDTALRRRFSFVEMMPDEKVIADKKFTDYERATIMNLINQRIEVLLDRNYTLGHSYFIKADFKNSFENEIIPLLQEYFYNDYGKIGLVLGRGFVREKAITAKNDKSIFADFDTKNEVDITKSYELIPFDEIDFDLAIQTLLA